MSLDHLATALEIKAVSEQRIISGHAAAWALDRVGDAIDRKAFDRTLSEKTPGDIAVLIGHDSSALPVGIPLVIRPDPTGLYTEVKIFDGPAGDSLLGVARGLKAHGQTLGLSIGFRVRDSKMERVGNQVVRKILDIDLVEFSYAARQVIANPRALVTSVKSTENKQGAVGTFDYIRRAVMVGLQTMYPDKWCRIEDIDSTYVYYSCEGSGGSIGGYWRAGYSQSGDGAATLSDPVPVAPDWRVVSLPAGDDDAMATAGKALSSSSDAAGGYLVEPDGGKFWVTKNGKRIRAFGTHAEAQAHASAMSKTIPLQHEVRPMDLNTLPDSAFLFVEPGGQLDAEAKTVPRALRHFAYRGADGAISADLLRGAPRGISECDALDTESKTVLGARTRQMLEALQLGKAADDSSPEWKSGAAIQVRAIAYGLLDASETIATELKAMSLLGSDTKDNGRLRLELRQKLAGLADELGRLIRQSELIDEEQDGAAQVALFRSQLQLLEV